jgi:hypothetical protein
VGQLARRAAAATMRLLRSWRSDSDRRTRCFAFMPSPLHDPRQALKPAVRYTKGCLSRPSGPSWGRLESGAAMLRVHRLTGNLRLALRDISQTAFT